MLVQTPSAFSSQAPTSVLQNWFSAAGRSGSAAALPRPRTLPVCDSDRDARGVRFTGVVVGGPSQPQTGAIVTGHDDGRFVQTPLAPSAHTPSRACRIGSRRSRRRCRRSRGILRWCHRASGARARRVRRCRWCAQLPGFPGGWWQMHTVPAWAVVTVRMRAVRQHRQHVAQSD